METGITAVLLEGQKKVLGLWSLGMDGEAVVEEKLEPTVTLRNPLK